MRRVPLSFILRFAGNVLRARLRSPERRKLVRPMMASLYLTTKCNFRCTYCDDGSQNMYPDIPEPDPLGTKHLLEILDILRRDSPGINIMGGEPTVRKDIDQMFEHIGRLNFDVVVLNTNGYLLDQHLGILQHLDFLVVSLDSVNLRRSDALIGVGRGGQTRRVMRNLEIARDYRARHQLRFDTLINTVVMPETIDDAWDVFDYALRQGFVFSPIPHLVGPYPNPGLVDNPKWQDFVDEVIRAKRLGAKIFGNMTSLRTIRSFSRFECYPSTRPIIYPNGDLWYPCPQLQTKAGNLLAIGDYQRAVVQGVQQHGPIPRCDARCHASCWMETSTQITKPWEGIIEAARFLVPRRRREIVLRRPPQSKERPALLPFHQLRALPSLPPDEVRRLRRAGRLEKGSSETGMSAEWNERVA